MAKPHATRTYAPLQFEALESHRFEDLVRNLLYDFRDWQKIEATGRGGSDGGFDARAFEKKVEVEQVEEGDDAEEARITEGNLWMIQCKREKQLTASGITEIIDDAVKKDQPPYGYILAAPVNFTKKSYDAFREALVDKGVTEFHLLGRPELEDMLYLPKNDRVLFAFFGISLVSKKRSRVSEVRAVVNNKNRLFRALGPGDHNNTIQTHVLIRDTNDTNYPNSGEYADFKKRPRWREYIASEYHPEGVRFEARRHFAYVDLEKKEWDTFPELDLLYREVRDASEPNEPDDLRERVQDFWDHLPLWTQGTEVLDCLLRYQDFDLIDKEGDAKFKMPHLYAEFIGKGGPFSAFWQYIEIKTGHQSVRPYDDYKRIKKFPPHFLKQKFNRIYNDKTLLVPDYLVYRMENGSQHLYLDVAGEYTFLRQRDVICVPSVRKSDSKPHAEVMHQQKVTASKMLQYIPHFKHEAEQQLKRELDPDETINLLQLKRVYDHNLPNEEGAT